MYYFWYADKESKKRQRSLQKFGIGGFVVRPRGPRFKEDEDGMLDQLMNGEGDKPKRKAKRPRKPINKLVESFPVYLQEAFFGKSLLDPTTKETDLIANTNDDLEDVTSPIKNENTIKLSKEEIKEIEAIKAKQKSPEKVKPDNRQTPVLSITQTPNLVSDVSKEARKAPPPLVEEDDGEIALDILAGDLLDNDFMDNIMSEGDDMKVEEGLVDFRGKNRLIRLTFPWFCTLELCTWANLFSAGVDDSSDYSLDQNLQDVNPKDEFNDILTTQFGLDNIDNGLPSMDSKDVEDIFKGVLIEESQETLFSQVNNVPTVTDGKEKLKR